MKKIILLTVSAIVLSGAAQAQSMFAFNNRIKLYKAELNDEMGTEQANNTNLVKEKKSLRKVENDQVSDYAKQNFYSDFGDVAVFKWQHEPSYDVAIFTKDGQQMEAYYGVNSTLVGTITPKVFSDLPSDAQKEITRHYQGYNTENIILYDDNEDNDTALIYDDDEFTADNYFVEMSKGAHDVVLRVRPNGYVSFFKEIK